MVRAGQAAAVWAVLAVSAPTAAQADWTKVSELEPPAGHDAAAVALADDERLVKAALLVSAGNGTAEGRAARVTASGLAPLAAAPQPLWRGPTPVRGPSVQAGAENGATVFAWAEAAGEGGREHVALGRLSSGAGGLDLLPSPFAATAEYTVEVLSVDVAGDGAVVVAYRAALAPGGEQHVRAALLRGPAWQPLHAGPWLEAADGGPADTAAVAFDGVQAVAATASPTAALQVARHAGAAAWTPLGTVGPPPPWNLDTPRLVAGGGVVRAFGAGVLGVAMATFRTGEPTVLEPVGPTGPRPRLAAVDGPVATPCALAERGVPGRPGAVGVTCLGADGLWSLLGGSDIRGGERLEPLAFSTAGNAGVFAVVADPDARGPHPALWRFDADATALPVVTGETTASLVAAVLPGGRPTSARLEWWRVGGAVTASPAISVGDGPHPVPVTVNLKDLRPGTAYRFRVATTNGAGFVAHRDQGFTTAADRRGPKVVATLPRSVRIGRRFAMRLRVGEPAVVRLALADARLRRLVRYSLRVGPQTRPTLARLLPRRRTLPPGSYLWLLEATDASGQRTHLPVRSVRVSR